MPGTHRKKTERLCSLVDGKMTAFSVSLNQMEIVTALGSGLLAAGPVGLGFNLIILPSFSAILTSGWFPSFLLRLFFQGQSFRTCFPVRSIPLQSFKLNPKIRSTWLPVLLCNGFHTCSWTLISSPSTVTWCLFLACLHSQQSWALWPMGRQTDRQIDR